jgi:hypothetical protein
MHEERCKKRPPGTRRKNPVADETDESHEINPEIQTESAKDNSTRKTSQPAVHRVVLSEDSSCPTPQLIIIARASENKAPKVWYADKSSAQEGLKVWGQAVLDEYCRATRFTGTAVLHTAFDMPSRLLPAPARFPHRDEKDKFATQQRLRRAHEWTQAIEGDLHSAVDACLIPTILSVGLDGWAAVEGMILPWVTRMPSFKLCIRSTELHYGLLEKYHPAHDGVHWGEFDSVILRASLEQGPGLDAATDNLISAWHTVQGRKDSVAGENRLRSGRNSVNLTRRS